MTVVSVVIPTYNRADLLQKAVESVLYQTYQDFEVIIVDDGSTDNTSDVVREYDDRVRYFHTRNQGVSHARNFGVGVARGKYVAFLDSDDAFAPHKLELQVRCMEDNPSFGMTYTAYMSVTENDEPINLHAAPVYPGGYKQMALGCTIATPTVMVQRDILNRVGGFDPAMHLAEDIDLWCRIFRVVPIQAIDIPLTKVLLHQSNTPRGAENVLGAYLYLLKKMFEADKSISWVYRRKAVARYHYLCAAELRTLSQDEPDGPGSYQQHYLIAARSWPFSRSAARIFYDEMEKKSVARPIGRISWRLVDLPIRIKNRLRRIYYVIVGRADWMVWVFRQFGKRIVWGIRHRIFRHERQ